MISSFRHYFAQAKAGWKVGLKYRFNFIIAMLTTPISLIIFYYLWLSIYDYTGQEIIRGFTFPAMVNYYVLSMIVGFFVWCDTDKWISQDVRRGHVITMFVYPMKFLWQHLAFEIGMNSLGLILEIIPVFIIGFVFFGLEVAPLFNIIMFLVSVILAFFLTFLLTFNVGLSSFWLKKIDGIRKVRRTLLLFLSGGMIPLAFFPESVQTVLHYLPFEYLRYVPINIYLAAYSNIGVLIKVGIQVAWIIGLYLLSIYIYKRAFRQFAGAGV
ncbi:ABC-2 family transporter protein [Candidatus Woesearchaeota archaeon]|nr:ABC-2 family transporter protein [Candidatus Woesearchaeota archaeon]